MKTKSQEMMAYQAVAAPAELAARTNQWATAAERWFQVMEQFPNQPGGYVGYGKALVELERYDEAEDLFLAANKLWVKAIQPLIGLARIASRTNQWTIAAERWFQVIEQFPNQLIGYVGCGKALVELERYDEAEDIFQEAVHRWPDNEQVLLRLVNACYQNLHWPEALGYLEKAVAHFPDSRRVWLKYGDLLLDLYEFEKAEQAFLPPWENGPSFLHLLKSMPEQLGGPGAM